MLISFSGTNEETLADVIEEIEVPGTDGKQGRTCSVLRNCLAHIASGTVVDLVLVPLRPTFKEAPSCSTVPSFLAQQQQKTFLMPSTPEADAVACDLLSPSVPIFAGSSRDTSPSTGRHPQTLARF